MARPELNFFAEPTRSSLKKKRSVSTILILPEMNSNCDGSGKIKRNGGMSLPEIYGIIPALLGCALISTTC